MEKKIFNLIIVDESGSMGYIRKQAFEGLNDTIGTIRKMQKEQPDIEQRITLLTFDSDHKTFLYDNQPAEACRMLRWEQYEPGAATRSTTPSGRAFPRSTASAGRTTTCW